MILEESKVHIENMELYDAGQSGELARYPIHFHVANDMDGSVIRSNSIHDTNQRCITVHGTDKLLIQDNVCYRPKGMGYFVEDADENFFIW